LAKIIKNGNKPARSTFKLINDREIIFLDEMVGVVYHGYKAEISLA
jgi:hypothetical protein